MGRRLWLFSGMPAGADSSAIIGSLAKTANAAGLAPCIWLRRIVQDLPAAKTVECACPGFHHPKSKGGQAEVDENFSLFLASKQ
jgi:hypothetical protein